MAGRWNLRLLGALEARNGDVLLTHFVSQPIAGLLALLALEPQRSHPREALIERLWPGVALEVGRNRLRNAISTLRRLIEPPGVPGGSVLVADRQSVRLAPNATTCDALEFEQAVRAGHFAKARALYRGELLPGFYDDWVQDERVRLVALHDRISDALPEPAAARAMPLEAAAEPSEWSTARPTLPSYLTSYFGREDERQRLLALVVAHRLVTLSGAGGCGKTRLAVEVARAADGFECVAFAALAECSSAEQLGEQLRVALQLPKASGDALDQAVAMLRDQPTLLVLDNFEQLVQAGGVPVVEALLTRVPTLHLLVTSRRVLGLSGEHDFALQPLPQPEPDDGLEQAARSPSVSLFVDRARSVRPDFQVTARNVEALVALCRALEGLPLAIELAASRSRAFSPAEMHAALSQRFRLLERGGRRGTRHGSLRVAIDWSWQLLSPGQQAFLLTLSVFRGGWSAMSAQAVSDEGQARDVLEELTADSLLRSESGADGATRFSMLDMIREYLRDGLEPAEAQRLRRRHRAHFLAQGMALGERGHAAPRDEMPNFIEALQTAVEDAEPALALALGVALRGEWQLHGMPAQVQALLERALAPQADSARTEASSSAAMRVHAHVLMRTAAMSAGRGAAAELHATQALLLAEAQPVLRAEALLAQAQQHWDGSRDTGSMRPLLAEALMLARREGALETEAGALSVLASITLTDGADSLEALELYGQAQRLYERAGIEHLANRMLFAQANCLAKLYRHQEALALLEECERRFVASGHVAALPELANAQGFLYSYMVRWRDGELAFARCAVGAARQQNRYLMCLGMWNLARPLAHRRKPDAAARLLAFAARYWVQSFGPLTDNDQLYIRQVRRLARVQVGDVAVGRCWRQGEQMTLAAALELAALSLLPAPAG